MPDASALPRLLDELAWMLRRNGFVVAPSQVIDLQRAVRAVGWDDPSAVCEATAAVILQRAADGPRLRALFTAFFAETKPSLDLWTRLRAQGFAEAELEALRELLDLLGSIVGSNGDAGPRLHALLQGGAEMDRLLQLAGIRREVSELRNPLQVGFVTQRAAQRLGFAEARARLAELRQHLRGALGARGDALVDALDRELDRAGDVLRDHVRDSLRRRDEDAPRRAGERKLEDVPFTSLDDAHVEDVARAVRGFADRLRGAARVRARRARRGRIDPGRTMRALAKTGGIPFRPVRRQRRRDRPRLLLLCDVSESVRTVSRFMLEFVYAAHDLFDRTRSFVFVSELGESTSLFERETPRVALAAAYGGDIVPVTDNSNYGRVLRAFEARYLSAVDRRTTVVILGDGRTNYHDAAEQTLATLKRRARAVYWLCSEARAGWAHGDSAMKRYASLCTDVFEVTNARELEEAARRVVAR